jgi:hypothetical protein
MNYYQLQSAIQDYTENQFPLTVLANGNTVSAAQQINRFIEQAELRIFNTVQLPSLRKNVTGTVTPNTPYLACPDDFLSSFSLAAIDPVTGEYEFLLNKDVNFIRQSYPNPTDTGKPRYYALFGPRFGAKNELSFILGPTPNQVYSVELHYYYYPISIVQRQIGFLGAITNPGASYTNGVYSNLPAIGGSGEGALIDVTVANNIVTSASLSYGGSGYTQGDSLSATIGSIGSGFAVTVSSVNNLTGTSWLGDNFDTVLLYGCLVEAYTYMKGETDMMSLYNQKYTEALQQLNRLGTGLERGDSYRDGQAKIKVNP